MGKYQALVIAFLGKVVQWGKITEQAIAELGKLVTAKDKGRGKKEKLALVATDLYAVIYQTYKVEGFDALKKKSDEGVKLYNNTAKIVQRAREAWGIKAKSSGGGSAIKTSAQAIVEIIRLVKLFKLSKDDIKSIVDSVE